MVFNESLVLETKGECDVHNLTPKVEKIVKKSKIKNGHILVFVTGSTSAIGTLEVGADLDKDLNELMEKLAPKNKKYHHDKRWKDGNGYSHVRSTLLGTSRVLPLIDGELVLGTWQQVVLIDFDNKPRERFVTVQIVGE